MFKLLIFGLVAVYAYRRWRALYLPGSRPAERDSRAHAAKTGAVDTVRCRSCGVYVPRNEACGSDGVWFCCAEHEREYRRTGTSRD